MKTIINKFIFSASAVMLFTNCQNKTTDEKPVDRHHLDSITEQVSNRVENIKSADVLSFNAYIFAENLKNDNFFESENIDKVIELKDVGVVSYLVANNEVTLRGVFYTKETNMAIPFNNRPPGGGAFVNQYFNNNEIKYNEEYKRTYTAGLSISLKDPKSVKKLKMYIASESSRVYEYQIDGEYRMGFVDLVTVKGVFKGYSAASIYPTKIYEIVNATLE